MIAPGQTAEHRQLLRVAGPPRLIVPPVFSSFTVHMYLRLALVTPLLLAFTLPAQEKPAEAQDPQKQIEELVKQRARLEDEIRYTKTRVEKAAAGRTARLRGVQQSFRSIDAGSVPRRSPRPGSSASMRALRPRKNSTAIRMARW